MHSFILRAAILPLFTLGIVATGCGYAPGVDGDPSAPPPGPPDIQFTLDDAAGPGLPPEECSVEAVTSFPRVNLFIAVDRSAAMLYSSRWSKTTGALGAFINDAKSAG